MRGIDRIILVPVFSQYILSNTLLTLTYDNFDNANMFTNVLIIMKYCRRCWINVLIQHPFLKYTAMLPIHKRLTCKNIVVQILVSDWYYLQWVILKCYSGKSTCQQSVSVGAIRSTQRENIFTEIAFQYTGKRHVWSVIWNPSWYIIACKSGN